MEQPLVSVIIPTYNRGTKLIKSLESVVKQTYKNIEIVIVDDGSIDDTRNLVNKFIQENSDYDINYIFHENQGVSISRNAGIKASHGKYICFLDSDDAFHLDKIEKQIHKIVFENADLCIAETKINFEDENRIKICRFPNNIVDVVEQYIKLNVFIHTSAYLKKEVVLSNKLAFREKCSWGEDVEFFLKVMIEARKICFINEALHTYNFSRKESLSSFNWDKIDKDIFIWNEIKCYIARKCGFERREILLRIIKEWRIPYAVLSKFYEGKKDRNYFVDNFWRYKDIYINISLVNDIKSMKLIFLFLICNVYFSICKLLFFTNVDGENHI